MRHEGPPRHPSDGDHLGLLVRRRCHDRARAPRYDRRLAGLVPEQRVEQYHVASLGAAGRRMDHSAVSRARAQQRVRGDPAVRATGGSGYALLRWIAALGAMCEPAAHEPLLVAHGHALAHGRQPARARSELITDGPFRYRPPSDLRAVDAAHAVLGRRRADLAYAGRSASFISCSRQLKARYEERHLSAAPWRRLSATISRARDAFFPCGPSRSVDRDRSSSDPFRAESLDGRATQQHAVRTHGDAPSVSPRSSRVQRRGDPGAGGFPRSLHRALRPSSTAKPKSASSRSRRNRFPAREVQSVLARAPAPRIINLQGSVPSSRWRRLRSS